MTEDNDDDDDDDGSDGSGGGNETVTLCAHAASPWSSALSKLTPILHGCSRRHPLARVVQRFSEDLLDGGVRVVSETALALEHALRVVSTPNSPCADEMNETAWGILLFYVTNCLYPKTPQMGALKKGRVIGYMPKLPWDARVKAATLYLKSPTLCPTKNSTIRSFQTQS